MCLIHSISHWKLQCDSTKYQHPFEFNNISSNQVDWIKRQTKKQETSHSSIAGGIFYWFNWKILFLFFFFKNQQLSARSMLRYSSITSISISWCIWHGDLCGFIWTESDVEMIPLRLVIYGLANSIGWFHRVVNWLLTYHWIDEILVSYNWTCGRVFIYLFFFFELLWIFRWLPSSFESHFRDNIQR